MQKLIPKVVACAGLATILVAVGMSFYNLGGIDAPQGLFSGYRIWQIDSIFAIGTLLYISAMFVIKGSTPKIHRAFSIYLSIVLASWLIAPITTDPITSTVVVSSLVIIPIWTLIEIGRIANI